MSRRPPARPPERVQWFDGAPLRRADLRDAAAHETRLLALHVSAMHGTWGAALGLSVVVGIDRREVVVTPGLAYTCRGEPLVLADALRLVAPRAVPGLAGDVAHDLVAAPSPAPGGWPCERVTGCEDAVRVAEIALRWELAGPAAAGAAPPPLAADIRLGDEVPLARVIRRADGTLGDPDYSRRRIARGLTRPHVGRGTVAGLSWRDGVYRLLATVDTSGAGFTAVPRYFVSLVAPPRWDAAAVVPLLSVAASRPTSFDVALAAAARAPAAPGMEARLAGAEGVSMAWVGVEMTRGCPPTLRAHRITALGGGLVDATPWLAGLAHLGVTGP